MNRGRRALAFRCLMGAGLLTTVLASDSLYGQSTRDLYRQGSYGSDWHQRNIWNQRHDTGRASYMTPYQAARHSAYRSGFPSDDAAYRAARHAARRAAYYAAVADVADQRPCIDGQSFSPVGYGANAYANGLEASRVEARINAPHLAPQLAPRPPKATKGRYVGRGVLGQPTLYAEGQPVRNFFRAFSL